MSDDRRTQILEATFDLIGARGLEGLRTRDVAARVKLNIATLHYYFATKDDLIAAVVEYTNVKLRTPPPRSRSRTDPEGLRAHLERAWATFEASPPLATVLQELSLHGHRHAPTRAAFRAFHLTWNATVEGALRHDIERGVVRDDLDVPRAARIVTSFVMGAMVQLGLNPKAFTYDRVASELERLLAARP